MALLQKFFPSWKFLLENVLHFTKFVKFDTTLQNDHETWAFAQLH